MLFTRSLAFESTASAPVARERLRTYAASRDRLDLAAFRRRKIIGWRLSEANEGILFQPEYGDDFAVDGARLQALVEPVNTGSRIRGRIILAPLARIVTGVWMLAVAALTVGALRFGEEASARVLGIGALVFGATFVMVRYRLSSMGRLVEARLRQSLEEPGSHASHPRRRAQIRAAS